MRVAGAVQVLERFGHLAGQPARLLPGQRAGAEHPLERTAAGPLADAVRDAVLHVAVEHPEEARVGRGGGSPRGVEEQVGSWIADRQDIHDDGPAEHLVHCPPHPRTVDLRE